MQVTGAFQVSRHCCLGARILAKSRPRALVFGGALGLAAPRCFAVTVSRASKSSRNLADLPLATISRWNGPSRLIGPLEELAPPPAPPPPRPEPVTLKVALQKLGVSQRMLGDWLLDGAPAITSQRSRPGVPRARPAGEYPGARRTRRPSRLPALELSAELRSSAATQDSRRARSNARICAWSVRFRDALPYGASGGIRMPRAA